VLILNRRSSKSELESLHLFRKRGNNQQRDLVHDIQKDSVESAEEPDRRRQRTATVTLFDLPRPACFSRSASRSARNASSPGARLIRAPAAGVLGPANCGRVSLAWNRFPVPCAPVWIKASVGVKWCARPRHRTTMHPSA
jgi:hypothetical protein